MRFVLPYPTIEEIQGRAHDGTCSQHVLPLQLLFAQSLIGIRGHFKLLLQGGNAVLIHLFGILGDYDGSHSVQESLNGCGGFLALVFLLLQDAGSLMPGCQGAALGKGAGHVSVSKRRRHQ